MGLFVVCFVGRQRKTLIISFGIANMCVLCGVLLCRSLVLSLLAKGVPPPSALKRKMVFSVACWGVHCDLGCLGERNNPVFCGRERDHSEVSTLIRFHVSL